MPCLPQSPLLCPTLRVSGQRCCSAAVRPASAFAVSRFDGVATRRGSPVLSAPRGGSIRAYTNQRRPPWPSQLHARPQSQPPSQPQLPPLLRSPLQLGLPPLQLRRWDRKLYSSNRGTADGARRDGAKTDGDDAAVSSSEPNDSSSNTVFYQPAPEGYQEPARPPRLDGAAASETQSKAAAIEEKECEMSRENGGDVSSREGGEAQAAEATGTTTTSTMAQPLTEPGPTTPPDPSSALPTTSTSNSAPSSVYTPSLPSQIQQQRAEWRKKFESMMDNLQSNIFMAGQTLNDLTGYSAIERLKKQIIEQETAVRAARQHVRECKDAYAAAIHRRSTSQREVNELLQRKHAWTPTDVERFTALYRSDHANEREEATARERLAQAERDSEEAGTSLSRTILARYHEEQIWSDKIRRMSTWGTWGLMGVNVLLFLVFQVAVEPWRRRRLVRGFEEKVLEALEKEREITVQREDAKKLQDEERPAPPGVVAAAAAAAIEVVREAAREMRGAAPTAAAAETVGEQHDARVEAVFLPEEEEEDAASSLKESEMLADDTPPTPPPGSVSPPPDLTPDSLHAQFHRLVAQMLLRLPAPLVRAFVDRFRTDTSVSVTPRDVSAIALEGAAAGAAVTSLAAGLLVLLFRGQ